jgi:hypothetical protein
MYPTQKIPQKKKKKKKTRSVFLCCESRVFFSVFSVCCESSAFCVLLSLLLLLWVLVVRGDGGNELPLDGDIQGGW